MSSQRDASELPEASATDHPADHLLTAWCPRCVTAVDAICPQCESHVEPGGMDGESSAAGADLLWMKYFRRVLMLLEGARNAKFMLGCYFIATGDAFAEGLSMDEFARRWSVKKQTVSKQCRQICVQLGLPPSRYMRKPETAAKFRLANRRPRKI